MYKNPTRTHRAMLLGGLIVASLTGCASRPERATVDSVKLAEERVETTGEFLGRAEKELNQFQKTLAGLKQDARKSNEIRAKDRFLLALGQFDNRLTDARNELENLKLANAESWKDYQRRVQAAGVELKDDSGTAE